MLSVFFILTIAMSHFLLSGAQNSSYWPSLMGLSLAALTNSTPLYMAGITETIPLSDIVTTTAFIHTEDEAGNQTTPSAQSNLQQTEQASSTTKQPLMNQTSPTISTTASSVATTTQSRPSQTQSSQTKLNGPNTSTDKSLHSASSSLNQEVSFWLFLSLLIILIGQ